MKGPIDIPVVVIGGAGVGLNLSIFLSTENVEHVVFEKHATTSILPRAHYLNQRTLEIFRQHGIDDAVLAQSCPPKHMHRVEWRTSLGGDRPFDGQTLGYIFGAGGEEGSDQHTMYKRDSPATSTNLPLIRLEPILRGIAEERNPGKVLFDHEVVDFVEKEDHVLVTVKNKDETTEYRAQYVVCADGGKVSTPKLGIKMEGVTGLVDFVSTHFKADLSEYWDDRTLVTHFINPEGESMANLDCGALLMMGPTWGRKCEEWILTFGFPVEDKSRFDESALPARIRQLLKLPDLDMEVLRVSHWVLDRVVADKYRQGRIFIAGDAAHRRPPTTGLGLNTGIEDAHNLAWKLSSVLKGKASVALLDTYEAERRPIGIQNSDWAMFTFGNMQVLSAAVGLMPGAKEYNYQRFVNLFSDTPAGRAQLHHIRRVIQTQNVEYSAHGIELGFSYAAGDPDTAVVDDGTLGSPPLDPEGQVYYPTTRPGHRLPHAYIETSDGIRRSTHDLLERGKHDFLLVTDEDGRAWIEAAEEIVATSGVEIGPVRVRARGYPSKPGPGLCLDPAETWANVREVENGGALLVRPDNFVAWRSRTACADKAEARVRLTQAVEEVLRTSLVPRRVKFAGSADAALVNHTQNGEVKQNGVANEKLANARNGMTLEV